MTSKPALTRLPAIGAPMMPRPMKATVVIGTLPPCRGGERPWGVRGSGGGAVQPAEALGGGAAGLVLQPDPAVVTRGRQLVEVAVQVALAGAGLVPAGGGGDLYVRDPRARSE